MPVSDIYNARSGSIAVAQTTALALMSVICPATKRDWAVAIHLNVGNTAAVAGSNMLFQLCRPGNSPTGTGGASFGGQNDPSSPASIGQLYTAWSTAPTIGEILYEKELPMASGAAWDWAPPFGYEWQIPAIANGSANAGLHIFVTASVATSTPVLVSLDISE
jgi:hypothetical protein